MRQTNVSYKFEEFDTLIDSAIADEQVPMTEEEIAAERAAEEERLRREALGLPPISECRQGARPVSRWSSVVQSQADPGQGWGRHRCLPGADRQTFNLEPNQIWLSKHLNARSAFCPLASWRLPKSPTKGSGTGTQKFGLKNAAVQKYQTKRGARSRFPEM